MHNVLISIAQRESAARPAIELGRMVDLTTTAMSYWGRDLKCRFANRACQDWLRVDPEIMLGCDLDSVLDILGLATHADLVEAALQGERRSVVQSFHDGLSQRQGLVQYIPDVRGHIGGGLLLQVGSLPAASRRAGWRK